MANLALSGLASGVDTSSIVDQLMAIERQSISRLQLKSSKINARDSGLKDIQAKLSALKSAAAALESSSVYASKQVAESSNPLQVSAEMGAGAPIGSTTIGVSVLAKSTQRSVGYHPSTSAQTITLTPTKTGSSPVTINVAANTTAASLVAQINARSDLPVFAAEVPATPPATGTQLVLSSRTAGPEPAGPNASGFTATATGGLFTPKDYLPGTGSLYRVNGGGWVEADTNVIEGAIPGVKLTLKAKTAGDVTVTVGAPTTDQAGIKAKVKGFVEAYNAVATAARAKLTEKSVPDASTTTDALKGQLFGDSGLSSLLNGLRSAVGGAFAGLGVDADTLAEIGISTGAVGAGKAATGNLVLDEAKLDAALAANFPAVRELLAGRPANPPAAAVDGIAQRFAKLVDAQVGASGVIDLRLKSSAEEQRRISDATSRTETRLEQREKRLRAQFAAMESALQASQTQQAWLTGQIASLGSYS